MTQFYGNSFAARSLLARWQSTLAQFPRCDDDDCLDFTYNNLKRRDWLLWTLKRRWLPKEYARGIWWMYANPVINHPEMAAGSNRFARINCPKGRRRLYRSRTRRHTDPPLFPRDCIIDTKEGTLCRLVDGELVLQEKTPHQFWV